MEENKKQPNTEKPRKSKIWLNLIFVSIILIVVVILLLNFVGDVGALLALFKSANLSYILLSLALILIYFFITAISGHSIFRLSGEKISLINSYLIQSTEPFFNGITPFSMGAAPIQGYYYHKCGASASKTTGVLLSQFIIYQLLITVLSTVFLIIFAEDFNIALKENPGFGWYIIIIGYAINCLVFLVILFFSFSKKTSRIVAFFIRLICKIKLFKKYEGRWLGGADNFTKNLQESMSLLIKNKKLFLISATLRLLSLLIYFAIPSVIVYALGYTIASSSQFFYIMGAVILASTTMMWIPLPGASGGTETAFIILLSLPGLSFYGAETAAIAAIMLMWRCVTYYFGLIYGAINYLILKRRIKQ